CFGMVFFVKSGGSPSAKDPLYFIYRQYLCFIMNMFKNDNLMGLHKIELRVSYFEEWCDYNKANLRYKLDTYSYGRYLSSRGNQHDTVVIIDFIYLFSDISMSGFLGYATIGSICSPLSVAIFGKGSRFDQKTIAEVWVHEIGHNLGFPDIFGVNVVIPIISIALCMARIKNGIIII
ncbi:hypothetical protein HZS_7821, partial [Henneguya salminicola]